MMKVVFLVSLFLAVSAVSKAQYYYNDVLSNRKTNGEYNKLKDAKFRQVDLESFEDDDSPSQGFFCQKKMNNDFSESVMISKSNFTGQSELHSWYQNGRVIKTVNTTPEATNTTEFGYDGKGNLVSVSVASSDNGDSVSFAEKRIYEYDSSGKLAAMKRWKNGKLFSSFLFKKDDNGNVIEEAPQPGSTDRKYFYYYDSQNRLTDVVHFNERVQKLLPDYMFQYNEGRRVEPKQMLSVDESGRNYFTWKYAYTSEGLPEIQKCYSKEKRLLGTIQYEYK